MRRLAVIGLLVVICACRSDRGLVSDSLAAHNWGYGQWLHLCCKTQGKAIDGSAVCAVRMDPAPAGCPAFGAALDEQDRVGNLASDTQLLGQLPKSARKAVKKSGETVEKAEAQVGKD